MLISSTLIAKARLVNQVQNGENWEKKILFVHFVVANTFA